MILNYLPKKKIVTVTGTRIPPQDPSYLRPFKFQIRNIPHDPELLRKENVPEIQNPSQDLNYLHRRLKL